MTKVISFISRKGGTGKTTNAINVATTLKKMGKEVVLIETDVNYSLSAVRKNELSGRYTKNHSQLDLVQTEETSVVKLIKLYQKSSSVDYIIVDSAANTSDYATHRISAHSNLVVVTTSLSMNDVMVAQKTLKDIAPAFDDNPALKVVLLPNRIHSMTSQETINKTLEHLNTPILDTFIPTKKIFTFISTFQPAEGYDAVVKKLLKLVEEVPEFAH